MKAAWTRLAEIGAVVPRAAVLGAVVLGAVVLGRLAVVSGRKTTAEKPWATYGGGADSARYFDSAEITRANVQRLQVVWTYPSGDTVSHPLMVHGAVYGRGRNGALVALDARTGRELWVHDGMQAMTTRGMNYWESRDGRDRRLIFSMSDYLQEIDASTGKSIPTFGIDGVVDLREGLGRDPATVTRIQSGTPGQVFENLIILGSATGEGYISPPGDVRAFDVITGKLVWQFHTVPRPGEFGYETWPQDAWQYIGGTNTWGEITVDARRGIVFFPTASPTYDFYGADRPGTNLFSDCLLALNARTGKRLWHFQTTHHDLWDYDNTAAPQLTTIRHDGRSVDVVALAGKTGFLYVFNRLTGEPIWPIDERPVARGEMPGEQYSPTQPFPTNPPAFVKQLFTADDISPYTNQSPQARAQFMEHIAVAKNVGLFTPISEEWTVHTPGNNGGALFGTTSAEPASGIVYVVGQNNPSLLRLYKPGEGRGALGAGFPAAMPGQAIYQRECVACHGADRAGIGIAPTLVTLAGRLDAAAIATVVTNGRGQMPANPRLSPEEMDQLTAFLLAPGGSRGLRAGGGPGALGIGGGDNAAPVPPGLLAGTGGARTRPLIGRGAGGIGGRGFATPEYPAGVPAYVQYSINGQYGTIGTMMKPPYTVITAYDLNKGAIKWQTGFGDDPSLAAQGIKGTGVTQMRNSVIATAGGLLFGFGGDSTIYAYDTETGKVLWRAPLGGATGVRGSPTMYELDGRAYLLVPIGNAVSGLRGAGGGGPAAPPHPGAPAGYVTFALTAR